MKAISVRQPWASLIALGAKRFETRNWTTDYRGPIAIHASKKIGDDALAWLDRSIPAKRVLASELGLPTGVIVAIANLTDIIESTGVVPVGGSQHEIEFGDFTAGRFLWKLSGVRRVHFTKIVSGSLGLWDWQEGDGWNSRRDADAKRKRERDSQIPGRSGEIARRSKP